MKISRWKRVTSVWWRGKMVIACGLLVCVICVGWVEVIQALGCGDVPPTKEREGQMVKHEGFYANYEYGYTVSIPKGLVGVSTPPPMPHHGFGIILSREPHGVIWVDGSHDAIDEWVSTRDIAETYVKWIKQSAKQVFSIDQQSVTLDDHPAIRLIARFACADGTLMVNDLFLTLLGGGGGIEYSIELESDAATYAEYRPILEQIAASWQFRELWNEVVCGTAYPFSSSEEWTSVTHWGQYTEDYTNQNYGYAVTIPAGMVGKSNYPTIPAYGIGILLSREGYLMIEGGCNWPKWASLEDAVAAYVRWITAEAHSVDGVEQQPATLGGIPAVRLTVRYECPAETPMVKDLFLAISNNTVYKIDLITTATHYDDDKSILEQFARTFRLTGAAKESCQWEEEGE